ncbi:hypothetical protein RI367_001338 [Sorochytrium milnesiophthora]
MCPAPLAQQGDIRHGAYSQRETVASVPRTLNLWASGITDAQLRLDPRLAHLRVLSLSSNPKVTCLEPLRQCTRLRELHLRDTGVTSWLQLAYLRSCRRLRVLVITGTPIHIQALSSTPIHAQANAVREYRHHVALLLPQIKWLDGEPVVERSKINDVVQQQWRQEAQQPPTTKGHQESSAVLQAVLLLMTQMSTEERKQVQKHAAD